MANSQARFKWTDDKLIDLIKCLQEFKKSMEFRNCASNANKVKLYESVRKSLNRYIWFKKSKGFRFNLLSLALNDPCISESCIEIKNS